MSIRAPMYPALGLTLNGAWPTNPVGQIARVRPDETRSEPGRFEIGDADSRPRGRADVMLARYGFARAVLDPTQFAAPLPLEDEEPERQPDFTGRARYAQTLRDRQMPAVVGEMINLVI